MEAPRQKLMKESATVVATTTFDVGNGSLPFVGDIRYSILAKARAVPFSKFSIDLLNALEQPHRQRLGQLRLQNLRGRLADVIGHAAIFDDAVLRRIQGIGSA